MVCWRDEEILAVFAAAVPTDTGKTSKLARQSLQMQFWLSLFLNVAFQVDDDNRRIFLITSDYINVTHNNLHKATHVLLFRAERNKKDAIYKMSQHGNYDNDELTLFIYFFDRERAVSWESCNLIGSGSGQYFPISWPRSW